LKFWKVGELELFWSGVKEYRLQNQEIERKLIWGNAHYSLKIFVLPPAFLKQDC
jgi:hypothetical protein